LGAGATATITAALLTKAALIPLSAGLVAVGMVGTPLILPGSDAGFGQVAPVQSQPASVNPLPQDPRGWYFYPEGAQGPVLLRIQEQAQGQSLGWSVLQTDQGNFFSDGHKTEIRNHRVYADDLALRTLPTDQAGAKNLSPLLSGRQARLPGLLVIVPDSPKGKDSMLVVRHPNALQEDYFQPDPRTHAIWVDQRDPMHKRGWTYFEVEGHFQGRPLSGRGRIPFVYAACKQHGPWFLLNLDEQWQFIDLEETAYISSPTGAARLDGGTFWQGLPRPWMGLHSVDLVRRDAGRHKLPFSSELDKDGRHAWVRITHHQTALRYTIDLDVDVVDRIDLYQEDRQIGELRFRYLQDIEGVAGRFTPPGAPASAGLTRRSAPGSPWLVALAEGSLQK